jgi:hypothetical protein
VKGQELAKFSKANTRGGKLEAESFTTKKANLWGKSQIGEYSWVEAPAGVRILGAKNRGFDS